VRISGKDVGTAEILHHHEVRENGKGNSGLVPIPQAPAIGLLKPLLSDGLDVKDSSTAAFEDTGAEGFCLSERSGGEQACNGFVQDIVRGDENPPLAMKPAESHCFVM
jgi:hypothetical protein